jgi:hypothetical protein
MVTLACGWTVPHARAHTPDENAYLMLVREGGQREGSGSQPHKGCTNFSSTVDR